MITESGTVIRVEGRAAWVATVKTSVCTACRARSGCGQRLLNQALEPDMDIRAHYDSDAVGPLLPGDRVEIGIAEGAVVGASLVAYGLPVLLMVLLSAWAGQSSLVAGALAALVGLGLGAFLVRGWLSRHSDRSLFEPVVLRRMQVLDTQEVV